MKKILLSFFALLFVLWNVSVLASDGKSCETIYSVINWARYFSSIHCTEDIKLSWVLADESSLKDVSQRSINDFIVSNNNKIIEHVNEWNKCDTISEVDEIQKFESVIYSNNNISYTSTTSEVESLTESIEDLIEKYNDADLYNEVYDSVKGQYPLGSLDYLRAETRQQYFDKQLSIKNDILEKQKKKLTLLYKLSESQKFIEWFYWQVVKVCEWYYDEKWWKSTEEERLKVLEADEEEEIDEEKAKIAKYKSEFNEKLWDKLDAMSKQTLKWLSIALLDYAENSPIFKRFSDSQKILVNMKIKALKEAVDDRIDN